MIKETNDPLEKRVQKAVLQHAFLRWESAMVIALTILLTAFAPQMVWVCTLPRWVWLFGGLIVEGLLVYRSYTDLETGRKVVAEMLENEIEPQRLPEKKLQLQVEEVLEYRSRMTAATRERCDSELKDSLMATAGDVDEWLVRFYSFAKEEDRYRQEKDVLERDKNRAAERIRQLEARADVETDPVVKEQIAATTEDMRRQISTIEALDKRMDQSSWQLEISLARLRTIYLQAMQSDEPEGSDESQTE